MLKKILKVFVLITIGHESRELGLYPKVDAEFSEKKLAWSLHVCF